MALLTADDILNKKFTATKFREGYDVVEVDDFLDEVLHTLRALQGENEELTGKLAAAEARVAELSRSGASANAQAPAQEQAQPVFSPVVPEPAAEPEPVVVAPEPVAAPEPVVAPVRTQAAEQAPTPVVTSRVNEPESATGMLQLAQKLHDDYVHSGQEEGERLVTEARAEGERIVREAQDTSDRTMQQLEQERSLLERKIDELRQFERDYRTRLQSYLEGLLGDLNNRASALPTGGSGTGPSGI